jgi:meiosis-specific transcription factor NDT80
MGNPVSPSLSARDNYTTSTPHLNRHPHTTLSPRHHDLSRYNLPDTQPRSVLSTTMSMSTNSAYAVGGAMTYGHQAERMAESPAFKQPDIFCEITCEGTPVRPTIDAKIDKGFFMSSDRTWTCYRRNYFAVSVSYSLDPWVPNGRLYISQGGKQPEQIQSMAVSLAAAVDGAGGKGIELIQHTPKRDKGPQLQMKKELLSPTPPGKSHDHSYNMTPYHTASSVASPLLPLQAEPDNTHTYSPASQPSRYSSALGQGRCLHVECRRCSRTIAQPLPE